MTTAERRDVERRIIQALIQDALKAGYLLNVNNGGSANELPAPTNDRDVLERALFSTDDERLIYYRDVIPFMNVRAVGWVRLIYGNSGWDVIADYTLNLEDVMDGARREVENALSKKAPTSPTSS